MRQPLSLYLLAYALSLSLFSSVFPPNPRQFTFVPGSHRPHTISFSLASTFVSSRSQCLFSPPASLCFTPKATLLSRYSVRLLSLCASSHASRCYPCPFFPYLSISLGSSPAFACDLSLYIYMYIYIYYMTRRTVVGGLAIRIVRTRSQRPTAASSSSSSYYYSPYFCSFV